MDLEKPRTDSKEVPSLGCPELARRWKPLASVGHSLTWLVTSFKRRLWKSNVWPS